MKVNNPYISVEISEAQFAILKSSIRRELEILFSDIQELVNPHISISYILGKKEVSNLEELADEISEGSFIMNINGIKAMDSTYYGGTIISLSLEHTDDFYYVQEFTKEWITEDSVIIKEDFDGGFKAHISLFVLKGLSKETINLLPIYLETALSNIRTKVYGDKFTIYNDQREKLIEKKFKI